MEDINNHIKNIINEEYLKLNQKINGINFLENLKFNILENLIIFLEKNELNQENISNYEFNLDGLNNSIEVKLIKLDKDIILLKKELIKNKLIIPLNANINIDILNNDSKNFISIKLMPKMGVCLSSKTIVNMNIPNNTIYLEIELNDKTTI